MSESAAEPAASDAAERIVTRVAAAHRYRTVCAATVRRLANQALAASQGDAREATKRTKRALHQIYGAFLGGAQPWPRLLAELEAACDADARQQVLRAILARHASTRERLPALERFAAEVTARCGRPRRWLDLGCGLQPLAAPWLDLAPDAVYAGVDLDSGLIEFVRAGLDCLGVAHDLRVADLLGAPELPSCDVALALKLWPTLEQQRVGSAAELLDALAAPLVVVSFPTRSLGGRGRDRDVAHVLGFQDAIARRGWTAEGVELPGERVYFVRK